MERGTEGLYTEQEFPPNPIPTTARLSCFECFCTSLKSSESPRRDTLSHGIFKTSKSRGTIDIFESFDGDGKNWLLLRVRNISLSKRLGFWFDSYLCARFIANIFDFIFQLVRLSWEKSLCQSLNTCCNGEKGPPIFDTP